MLATEKEKERRKGRLLPEIENAKGGGSEAKEKDMRSRGGLDNAWKRRDKRGKKDKEMEKVRESVEEREKAI